MPLYEYKCKVCDEYFEVEQSFSEDTLATIAGCTVDESGQHQVKKIFAAPAISFKGGGFYRNDARPSDGGSKSSSKTSTSGSESNSTSSESSAGSSDSGSSDSGSSDSGSTTSKSSNGKTSTSSSDD